MDVDCQSLLPCQWTTIKWRHCPFEKELGTVTPGIQRQIFLMHFDMLIDSPPPSPFRAAEAEMSNRALSSDLSHCG